MLPFPSEITDGHTIVTINNVRYLLDTGSPISFGEVPVVSIDGKDFALQPSALGMTIEKINRLSGLQIDGLMGMNILQQFDVRITPHETFFSSTTFPLADNAVSLPIVDSIMTIPVVQIGIAGETHRLYFDTGAKLAYLHEDLLEGQESNGEMNDFYPTIGTFTVPTHRVSIDIGGQQPETMTFGVLPPPLKPLLYFGNIKGILGSELLRKYNVVLSNLTKQIILEEKH